MMPDWRATRAAVILAAMAAEAAKLGLCTLATGSDYRAMARRLIVDLSSFAPGVPVCLGTDRPAQFRGMRGVSVIRIAGVDGRWQRYNAKRLVLRRAIAAAQTAVFIDADSRVTAPLPVTARWPAGLSAAHENLRAHLQRWWPANFEEVRDAAHAIGVPLDSAPWIGESLYVLARDGGREQDFIKWWAYLGLRICRTGFRGGEGNIMGLAAAKAGLPVRWGPWARLKESVSHLNASQAINARRRGSLTNTWWNNSPGRPA